MNAMDFYSDEPKVSSLIRPIDLHLALPLGKDASGFVKKSRLSINNILDRKDPRLLVVVGPCSIHDIEIGKAYAQKLQEVSKLYEDRLLIVMRTYFEKPRTACGWKGFIMDPHLNGSYDIEKGLYEARAFLQYVLDLNLPTAVEILDTIVPAYIQDCICWAAIGARTIESQIHRQLASGLAMPLGFKNTTEGSVSAAVRALKAARSTQTFLSVDIEGKAAIFNTQGNRYGHIIMRGSEKSINYDSNSIQEASDLLKNENFLPNIMIDCAHGNSSKHDQSQSVALNYVIEQIPTNSNIMGVMFESNLMQGKQVFPSKNECLLYGVSITDPCLGWDETDYFLKSLYLSMDKRFSV